MGLSPKNKKVFLLATDGDYHKIVDLFTRSIEKENKESGFISSQSLNRNEMGPLNSLHSLENKIQYFKTNNILLIVVYIQQTYFNNVIIPTNRTKEFQELKNVKNKLQEKDMMLVQMEKERHERDMMLVQMEKERHERDKKLEEQNKKLEELNKKLEEQNKKLEEQYKILVQMEKERQE